MALNSRIVFFSFLLFLLCSFNGENVYGATDPSSPYHVVPGKSLFPNPSCHHPPTEGSSTLGPQKLRVTYNCPQKRTPPGSDSTTASPHAINDQQLVPRKSPHEDESMGSYTVEIEIGTPKRSYSLIMDTGSDISWINCNSKSPSSFNPAGSSSFSKGGCVSKETNYSIKYGDNSSSKGFYGCDTLTVEPDVFAQFQFGCAQDNKGEFGQAVGILGLGQGPFSFVSQTASKTGKSFSYCLPYKQESTGYLLFGSQSYSSFQSSRLYTPLLPSTDPSYESHYVVVLVGITVGTKRLKISPSIFSSPGTILDSGTPITRLPGPAYSAMRSEFRRLMKNFYPSALLPGDDELLDTCYDLKPYIQTNVKVPKVMLHFAGGTTVDLHTSAIFWTEGKGGGVSCLAFAAKKRDEDLSIIGSTQQKTMDVHYDIKNRKVGFGMNACT